VTDDIDLDYFQRPGPFPGDPTGDYPILHDWKPLRSGSAVRLSGSVRNHPDLPDGEIVTSPLRDIACDRSWCRTFNTLYLLGEQSAQKVTADEPPRALPLLLRLLLAEDWSSAAKIACDGMMPHSLLLDIAGPSEAFRLANLNRELAGLPPRFRLRFAGPSATLRTWRSNTPIPRFSQSTSLSLCLIPLRMNPKTSRLQSMPLSLTLRLLSSNKS